MRNAADHIMRAHALMQGVLNVGHIAGHALALGLVLVTHNTREFARVPGLAIEAGRDSRDQGSPKVACSAPSPHSNPCPAHRGETVQVCKDGDP